MYFAVSVVILVAVSTALVMVARHRHHAALLVGHDKTGFIYRRADGTLRRVPLGDPRLN